MTPLIAFFIAYVLPWAAGMILVRRISAHAWRLATIHALLLVSTSLSLIFLLRTGNRLPLGSWPAFALFGCAMIITYLLVRRWGILYAASAFLQEVCMLAAVSLLDPLNPGIIILLVMAPFALSHGGARKDWDVKVPLTAIGGILSIALFLAIHEPLLNTALHAFIGAWLIRKGLLFLRNNIPARKCQECLEEFLLREQAVYAPEKTSHASDISNKS